MKGRVAAWRERGVGLWLLTIAVIAGAYAIAVSWTGGFTLPIGPLKIRSHDEVRPAAIALVALFLFLAIDHRRVRGALAAGWQRADSPGGGRFLAVAAICWTLLAGAAFNTYAAGGGDSYGYVSQAQLLARGTVTERLPIDPAFRWDDARRTLVPLGYIATADPDVIAPTYPPGLPMLMAAVWPLGEHAVYLVVPVCGAFAVACVWLLGVRLGDPLAGGAAAILLSASPTFLYQVVQPMSDVPAAGCWLAALVCAARVGQRPAMAGFLTALAVLVRPNLAPLALIPALLVAVGDDRRLGRLVRFLIPLCAGVGTLMMIQYVRYGSPLASGYGSFSSLFGLHHVPVNIRQYSGWLTQTHTPFIWIAFVAPLIFRACADRPLGWALFTFMSGVIAAYLPYVAFQPHEWQYTRFLLPAIAPMLLLAALVALRVLRLIPVSARLLITLLAVAALTFIMVRDAVAWGAFDVRQVEQKYPRAGAYVRTQLPRSAYVFALQHSGSIRLYGERPIVRWDLVKPHDLDRVIATLRSRGYVPVLVADTGEVEDFRARFAGERAVNAMMVLATLGDTRVYRFE